MEWEGGYGSVEVYMFHKCEALSFIPNTTHTYTLICAHICSHTLTHKYSYTHMVAYIYTQPHLHT